MISNLTLSEERNKFILDKIPIDKNRNVLIVLILKLTITIFI